MEKKECCGAHTDSKGCVCEDDIETFTLIDDEGNEVEALVLGTFEIEDDSFIALAIIKENEEDLDDDVIFFQLDKSSIEFDDDEDIALQPIEDDELYDKVSETFYNFIESAELDGQE